MFHPNVRTSKYCTNVKTLKVPLLCSQYYDLKVSFKCWECSSLTIHSLPTLRFQSSFDMFWGFGSRSIFAMFPTFRFESTFQMFVSFPISFWAVTLSIFAIFPFWDHHWTRLKRSRRLVCRTLSLLNVKAYVWFKNYRRFLKFFKCSQRTNPNDIQNVKQNPKLPLLCSVPNVELVVRLVFRTYRQVWQKSQPTNLSNVRIRNYNLLCLFPMFRFKPTFGLFVPNVKIRKNLSFVPKVRIRKYIRVFSKLQILN